MGYIGNNASVDLHLHVIGRGGAFFLDVGILEIHPRNVADRNDVSSQKKVTTAIRKAESI